MASAAVAGIGRLAIGGGGASCRNGEQRGSSALTHHGSSSSSAAAGCPGELAVPWNGHMPIVRGAFASPRPTTARCTPRIAWAFGVYNDAAATVANATADTRNADLTPGMLDRRKSTGAP
jgi:hypothetical protein